MLRSALKSWTQCPVPLLSFTRGMKTRKTTQLKEMLLSPETEFLMEAHSGLSAKIVEEAGRCCHACNVNFYLNVCAIYVFVDIIKKGSKEFGEVA